MVLLLTRLADLLLGAHRVQELLKLLFEGCVLLVATFQRRSQLPNLVEFGRKHVILGSLHFSELFEFALRVAEGAFQARKLVVEVLAQMRDVEQHVAALLTFFGDDARDLVYLLLFDGVLADHVRVDDLVDRRQEVVHFIGFRLLGTFIRNVFLRHQLETRHQRHIQIQLALFVAEGFAFFNDGFPRLELVEILLC